MRRKIIPYDSNLKELARKLRNDSTLGEILLWNHLKGKRMMGYDFHRQKPLLKYIADFYCAELDLVIEIDGDSHQNESQQVKDEVKETDLSNYNILVIRFLESEVRRDIDNVLRTIEFYIEGFENNLKTHP
jgi:very-short-patch-repair endonuclease